MISRRHFLSLSALALAHRAVSIPVYRPKPPKAALRIIVMGAGASGLTAAYELDKLGHQVTVLEAKDYAGGRLKTLRNFDDGLYAEAGALVLGGATTAYAKEMGLKLLPMTELFNPDNRHVVYLKNQRFEVGAKDQPQYPFDLSEEEKGLDIRPLQSKYFYSQLPKDLESLNEPGFPQDQWLYLDDISLKQFMKDNGASDAALELMYYRYFGAYANDLDHVSVLQLAKEMASFRQEYGMPSRVEGGNDRICAEMARRLEGKVHLSAPVKSMIQNDNGVMVNYQKNGRSQQLTGDIFICAIPPQVVSKVDFSQGLSARRLEVLGRIEKVAVTRTLIQTSHKFWQDQGLSGFANTDLPIDTVMHSSAGIPDQTRGILESFTYMERAEKMAAMTYQDRLQVVKEQLELVYPGLNQYAERHDGYAWGSDEFQRGGHISFRPGQYREFGRYMASNEHRVYFAGDSYGGVPGYSHSAFQSGRHIAQQVNKLVE